MQQKKERLSKIKNWWYYYKYYVICGVILLGIACQLIGNALGLWENSPDYQIAYIGKTPLPGNTITALEQAFSSISSDFNGDGEVIVKIHQYISGSQSADPETMYYEYGSEITLIGDINDCESYFFLMDNPESFQRKYHILASPDGSCPAETDNSVKGKVIAWHDNSILSEMNLGSYSDTILGQISSGDNQELLSGLFLGRRCFYTDTISKNSEHCSKLWDFLVHD